MCSAILAPPATSTAFAGHRAHAFATTCGKVKVAPTAPSMASQRSGTTPRVIHIHRARRVAPMLPPATTTVDAQMLAFATAIMAGMVGRWSAGIKFWRVKMDGLSGLLIFQIATSKCLWVLDFAASVVCGVLAPTLELTFAATGAQVMAFAFVTRAGVAWIASAAMKATSLHQKQLHPLARRTVCPVSPAAATVSAMTLAPATVTAAGRVEIVTVAQRTGSH